jgi:hypothetical protein
LSGGEVVDGNRCSIVEGKTRSRCYRLWLDVEQHYRIRKAAARKAVGDLTIAGPLPLKEGSLDVTELAISIDHIATKSYKGFTVPASGVTVETKRYSDGRCLSIERSITRSQFEVNPDFGRLNAFVMDGIPDGTAVVRFDRDANDHVTYVWRGGEVVADDNAGATTTAPTMKQSDSENSSDAGSGARP